MCRILTMKHVNALLDQSSRIILDKSLPYDKTPSTGIFTLNINRGKGLGLIVHLTRKGLHKTQSRVHHYKLLKM